MLGYVLAYVNARLRIWRRNAVHAGLCISVQVGPGCWDWRCSRHRRRWGPGVTRGLHARAHACTLVEHTSMRFVFAWEPGIVILDGAARAGSQESHIDVHAIAAACVCMRMTAFGALLVARTSAPHTNISSSNSKVLFTRT